MRVTDWRRLTDYWDHHPPSCELLEMTSRWVPPKRSRTMTAADEAALDAAVKSALGEAD